MQRINVFSMFLALAAVLTTGCNVATEGAQGKVSFTPDDCGRYAGCDFASAVGVGGVTNLYISGIDGYSTVGMTLLTENPEVLTVMPIGDVGGRPTWELAGVAPGLARLVALASDGTEADYIDVAVEVVSGLTMAKIIGDAVEPGPDVDGYDEHWIVNADQRVALHVVPVGADAQPVMGRYEYVPTVENQEFVPYVTDATLLSKGQLDFTVPAGQYSIVFASDLAGTIRVLIDAQTAAP